MGTGNRARRRSLARFEVSRLSSSVCSSLSTAWSCLGVAQASRSSMVAWEMNRARALARSRSMSVRSSFLWFMRCPPSRRTPGRIRSDRRARRRRRARSRRRVGPRPGIRRRGRCRRWSRWISAIAATAFAHPLSRSARAGRAQPLGEDRARLPVEPFAQRVGKRLSDLAVGPGPGPVATAARSAGRAACCWWGCRRRRADAS